MAGPGSGYMRPWAIAVLAVLLTGLAGLAAYSLIQFWPPGPPSGSSVPPDSADVGWFVLTLSRVPRDVAYFVVVLLSGTIAGSVHSLRSLAWYVGNRNMRQSWFLRLMLLPIVGSLLALVTYIVLRAGFVAAPGATDVVSPFGFAALGVLVGLFSDQTIGKLKDIFETVLTPAEKGADTTKGTEPVVEHISPLSGAAGSELTITGTNLAHITQVLFGNVLAIPDQTLDGEIKVKVPGNAQNGVITVVAPGGRASSHEEFSLL